MSVFHGHTFLLLRDYRKIPGILGGLDPPTDIVSLHANARNAIALKVPSVKVVDKNTVYPRPKYP